MHYEGVSQGEIAKLLSVSQPFVSKWKRIFGIEGVAGIKLQHKGSEGYLGKKKRLEVIRWIKQREHLLFIKEESWYEDESISCKGFS